jgi:Flp pilus assembly pilin Flp
MRHNFLWDGGRIHQTPNILRKEINHKGEDMKEAIKKAAKKNRKFRRGQGMTEYIIIVALIAIAAMGVVTLFGNNIRHLFGGSANALAGRHECEEHWNKGN